MRCISLSFQDASTTDGFDLLLSLLREETSLNDDGLLREVTTAEDFKDSLGSTVDDRDLITLLVVLTNIFRNQSPQLIYIDGRDEVLVNFVVETSLTDLTEVTRVISIKESSSMMETTSITTTSFVFTVLT